MVWNDELLFLHPQKTAGMAVSHLLWETLNPPVFNSVPQGHWDPIFRPGVAQVIGLRHENLYQAAAILAPFRRDLSEFKKILVVMRNPYDMEVSRYFHLRKPEAHEKTDERNLALSSSFEEFELKSEFRLPRPDDPQLEFEESIKNYYSMGVAFLSNLQILRYETLYADLNRELTGLGYGTVTVPRVNVSDERRSADYQHYIRNPEVEEAIFRKYTWIFDQGFYARQIIQDSSN